MVLLLCIIGGTTILDKKYFLWLQIIALLDDNFNVDLYLKLKKELRDNISVIYNNIGINIERKLESIGISRKIIDLLENNEIKKKTNELYIKIEKFNLDIVCLSEYEHILKYSNAKIEIPFCFIISKIINLNNKNILIYYNDYFSKGAIYMLRFISKIINQNNGNTISEYNEKNITNINVMNYLNIFDKITNNINSKNIILADKKYLVFFLTVFIDCLVIVEARNEKVIQNLVDVFVESGKDVYVVPSSIFNKNGYFSNYLIKQGAEIILGANDIKLIVKKDIR